MNGYFSFVTGHFSEYAIVYDENAADTDTDDSALTGKAARYKNTLTINAGLKVSQTKSRININWGKVKDADGYDIYVQYCGKKFGDPVATVEGKTSAKIKTINGEKLKLTKNFKVRVVAYKLTDGKKKVLCKTVVAHIVGRNNKKFSNPKKLTVNTKKLTLSAGETAKVKAKVVLCDPSKKSLTDKHAPTFRYASSDKSVAKVDKKRQYHSSKYRHLLHLCIRQKRICKEDKGDCRVIYTNFIPSETDAGICYIRYKVTGDENHIVSSPETFSSLRTVAFLTKSMDFSLIYPFGFDIIRVLLFYGNMLTR